MNRRKAFQLDPPVMQTRSLALSLLYLEMHTHCLHQLFITTQTRHIPTAWRLCFNEARHQGLWALNTFLSHKEMAVLLNAEHAHLKSLKGSIGGIQSPLFLFQNMYSNSFIRAMLSCSGIEIGFLPNSQYSLPILVSSGARSKEVFLIS